MTIKVLQPDLVLKIAAGEVIERPASVVKELIENSLDAGASQVTVEVDGGGIRSIKVMDDGTGIQKDDVELAFYRYATSKISNLADLESISSLGFRGEALPSIAAVAEVELSTKTSSDSIGSYVKMQNGELFRHEDISRPSGTTVTVNHLFRYLPARLKFLKSVNTENSHITHVVSQYALAFPEVKFSLLLDKRLSVRTVGDGELRGVVNQIFGFEIAEKMLEMLGENMNVKVNGLVSPPSFTRYDRSSLSFFVNRRWVHSPLLVKAIEQAYHGLLMVGRHPLAVVQLTIPPNQIDVNVHPAKAQIKFLDEQAIFANINRTVGEALRNAPIAKTNTQFSSAISWLQESPLEVKERAPTFEGLSSAGNASCGNFPALRLLGQVANTYIVAEGPDGLYIIDQHAAHERIRFDIILEQWTKQQVEVQGLLQPMNIELSPREEEMWRDNQVILLQFGFIVESFSDRHYLIRSVPALVANENMHEVIADLLNSLSSRGSSTPWEEKVAQSLSCHGAIKAGQQLSSEEMRELINQLEQSKQPRTCPHGRPIMVQMSLFQLEKEFGRRA
jgi:DNA mismatch repair protein MutL